MAPGSRISVDFPAGVLVLRAADRLARSYEWAGWVIEASPCPRLERWYGSRGLLDPSPNFSRQCRGIGRSIFEESQQHFVSNEDAAWWLERFARIAPEGTRWTDDGLVVRCLFLQGRGQLNVDVVQLCINGSRPVALAGASNSSLSITTDQSESGRRPCAAIPEQEALESRRVWEEHYLTADEYSKRVKSRQ